MQQMNNEEKFYRYNRLLMSKEEPKIPWQEKKQVIMVKEENGLYALYWLNGESINHKSKALDELDIELLPREGLCLDEPETVNTFILMYGCNHLSPKMTGYYENDKYYKIQNQLTANRNIDIAEQKFLVKFLEVDTFGTLAPKEYKKEIIKICKENICKKTNEIDALKNIDFLCAVFNVLIVNNKLITKEEGLCSLFKSHGITATLTDLTILFQQRVYTLYIEGKKDSPHQHSMIMKLMKQQLSFGKESEFLNAYSLKREERKKQIITFILCVKQCLSQHLQPPKPLLLVILDLFERYDTPGMDQKKPVLGNKALSLTFKN